MSIEKVIEIKCDGAAYLDLSELNHFQGKLKHIDKVKFDQLKKSLVKDGFPFALSIWKNGNKSEIIDGHHRRLALLALREEGYLIPPLPVNYIKAKTRKEAAKSVLISNSRYARMTPESHSDFMIDFELDLEDIEFLDLPDIGLDLSDSFDKNEGLTDPDEVPEVPVEPKSKLGQIYKLGEHRLMCGDSTDLDTVEKLMNGEKADITFTSPPYNINKVTKLGGVKYLNDEDSKSDEDFKRLLNSFTAICLEFSDYVFSNIQSLAGNKVALIEHLYEYRDRFSDTIIWNKETAEPAMAHRVLNSQFEYIHVFSKEAKRTIGKKDFRGTLSNVFSLNSRSGKEYAAIHKATFRVELPEYFISNFSVSSCLDPFGGTGTTLIACEKTNRKCFMVELDPHYIDVIISRWEKFTGKTAELLT